MVVLIMPENKTDEHKHMMAAVFPLVFFLWIKTKNEAMLKLGFGLWLQDKTLCDITNYCNKNWVSFFGITLET